MPKAKIFGYKKMAHHKRITSALRPSTPKASKPKPSTPKSTSPRPKSTPKPSMPKPSTAGRKPTSKIERHMPRTFDQVKRGHVIRIGAGKQRHVVLSNNRGVITAVKQNVYSKSTISVTKSQKKKITYHGKRKVTKSMSAVHARDPITLTQSRGGYKNPYAKKRK